MYIKKGKLIFHNKDLWNLDMVLSKIISQALIQFKNSNRHGYPTQAIKDVYFEQVSEKELSNMMMNSSYDEKLVIEYWEKCLDNMIFAFSEHKEYYEIEESLTEAKSYPTKNPKLTGMTFVPKNGYTQKDVDEYNIRQKAYDDAIKKRTLEGRNLFMKYYDSLWD